MSAPRPPRAILLAWLGLLVLLGLTVSIAYQPLGTVNAFAALGIASIKTLIVAAVFMELRERQPLAVVFAAAGLFWLGILLWLASTDFATRAEYLPRAGTQTAAAQRLVPWNPPASGRAPTSTRPGLREHRDDLAGHRIDDQHLPLELEVGVSLQ
jgi:cytochrome c oxidase subunit 4